MKNDKSDIIERVINGKGKIKCASLKRSRKRKSDSQDTFFYEKNDVFQLLSTSPNVISGITLKKPRKKAVEVPLFMGIKPSFYINDEKLHIIFLLGNEPCDLHRLIIVIEGFDRKIPTFNFHIDDIFEKCKCEPRTMSTVAYMTAGDGTWPPL